MLRFLCDLILLYKSWGGQITRVFELAPFHFLKPTCLASLCWPCFRKAWQWAIFSVPRRYKSCRLLNRVEKLISSCKASLIKLFPDYNQIEQLSVTITIRRQETSWFLKGSEQTNCLAHWYTTMKLTKKSCAPSASSLKIVIQGWEEICSIILGTLCIRDSRSAFQEVMHRYKIIRLFFQNCNDEVLVRGFKVVLVDACDNYVTYRDFVAHCRRTSQVQFVRLYFTDNKKRGEQIRLGMDGPPCIKIGNSRSVEPKSRKDHPSQPRAFWSFSVYQYSILISWRGFLCSILIGCRQFAGFGRKWRQCNSIVRQNFKTRRKYIKVRYNSASYSGCVCDFDKNQDRQGITLRHTVFEKVQPCIKMGSDFR